MAQHYLVGDEPLQKWRTTFQPGDDFCCIRTVERNYEHSRVAQIGAEPHFCNSNTGVPQRGITAFTPTENPGKCVPQLFPDPKSPLVDAMFRPDSARKFPSFADHETKR